MDCKVSTTGVPVILLYVLTISVDTKYFLLSAENNGKVMFNIYLWDVQFTALKVQIQC